MIRSVGIQFHMLFEELIAFVEDVSSRHHLEVELERFYPKAARRVPVGADLTEAIKHFGQVDRFWLLYKVPKSKKTERFMLNVGRQRGDLLAQAQLGAGASTEDGYRVLKQVARSLKQCTKEGIWAIGGTGAVAFIKKDRISEGATIAARTGKVVLANMAFGPSFLVDPPEPENK